MLLPDLPLIRVLLDFPPGRTDAPALLHTLQETGLSPLEAAQGRALGKEAECRRYGC